MTPLQIVKAVRKLISNPRHWCKKARNSGDRYCLVGAYERVVTGGNVPPLTRNVDNAYSEAQKLLAPNDPANLSQWNDRATTTHADVIALLDKRIEELSCDGPG